MATKRPPGLIYDERDIDAVVRTMLGEAAGEGDDGLAAIANVAANRFNRGGYGKTLYDVVHAPKQFSAWNDASIGGNGLVNVSADDPRYIKARAIAEEVLNGRREDLTGGAVNYFAPAGMTGKNGTVKGAPNWASKMSYTGTIGGHKFYSDGSAAGAAEAMARGGNSGSNVSTYQQQLAQRGFDPGPVDGIRGPRTTAAVKAFQKANGLTVDGIVGPKTMAALQGQQRPSTQPQPQPFNPLPAPPPLVPPARAQNQDRFNSAFGATAGDMESPLTRLGTTRLGWEGDEASWNGTDIRAPIDPGAYARARLEATNVRGAADDRMASLMRPSQVSPPPLMPPTAPMPMPGRPASLNGLPPVPGRLAPTPMPGRPMGLNGAPPMPPPPIGPRDQAWVNQGPDMAALDAITKGAAPQFGSAFRPETNGWGSNGFTYSWMKKPPPVAPRPLTPSPLLRMPPGVSPPASPAQQAAAARSWEPTLRRLENRARQIAEGKASQLDEFGMIR
jgi:peptidoglycan hydrolase-like protein with peptidoglycan-binding domain